MRECVCVRERAAFDVAVCKMTSGVPELACRRRRLLALCLEVTNLPVNALWTVCDRSTSLGYRR